MFADHAFRQRSVDFLHPFVDAMRDRAAVFTHQHEGRAEHDFVAVVQSRASAQFVTQRNLCHIANVHRHALAARYDDAANIRDIAHLPGRANQILLAVSLDVARADIRVVLRQRLHHVVKAERRRRRASADRA